MVRSRFKENLEKEKACLFHLAREKKKGTENSIEKLLLHGQKVTLYNVNRRSSIFMSHFLMGGKVNLSLS